MMQLVELKTHLKKIANSSRKKFDNLDLEIDQLIYSVTELPLVEQLANPDMEISSEVVSKLEELVQSRIAHKPLSQITRSKAFFKDTFYINDQVLTPRSDTEKLVLLAGKNIKSWINYIHYNGPQKSKSINILEIGTGSGAIIISLIKKIWEEYSYYPDINFNFLATDISNSALEVARENAKNILPDPKSLEEKNIGFELLNSDIYENIDPKESFQLIISNPPYIPEADRKSWQEELNYEPEIALISGKKGLDAYTKIILGLKDYLDLSRGSFLGEIYPKNLENLKRIIKDTFDQSPENYSITSHKAINKANRFIQLDFGQSQPS